MPFIIDQNATLSGYIESLYERHLENRTQIGNVSGNPILDGYHSNVYGSNSSSSSSSSSNLPSTGVSARFYLDTYNNTSAFGSSFRGRRFRGTPFAPSGVLQNDTILHFSADGYASTGVNVAGGVMLFAATENWNTSGNGTLFRLRLTPSGQTLPIDRIWISDSGCVGLSNITPSYTLDVSGSGNFTQGIYHNGVPVVNHADFTTYTGKFFKIVTELTSGVDFQIISFPQTLPSVPIVICEMENDRDNYLYNHAVYNVNTNNFSIGFSDVLSNSGYRLYTTVNLV